MKRLVLLLLAAAAPALAQTADQGKAVYDRHCTACHGADGGAGERAPAIVIGSATTLRGERSEAQILDIVRNGIPGTGMPAWKTRLPEDDILAIGAYVHALRGTAIDNPLPGDPAHGREVFWGKGDCGSCHMLGGRGGVIGPDLGNIAVQRKAAAISDALTKVQHRVYGDGGVHLPAIPLMDYNQVTVVMKDGRSIEGVMRNQDAWSVQFIGMDGKYYSFDRDRLRSVTIRPGSVMPTDYDKRLSPDEFRDLLAFLTRQGTRPVAAKDAE
ncbi:MAG TPA: c-type cytochrome [Rhizomicrobium sp.]|nr:c-type cytochrome [Rhizomicrobium sp.]